MTTKPFLMKGHTYGEHKHKLVYPVIAEIKYDEIRLHVKRNESNIEFLSYAGKPLHNLQPWADKFYEFMVEQNVWHLDMGVLVNGNFNDSYRWCRSSSGYPTEKLDKKTGKVAPALNESMVQFYLFDVPGGALGFEVRRYISDYLAEALDAAGVPTKRPRRWRIASEFELEAKFVEVRELGFEGLMVKSWGHTYQCGKRIDGWLKMKPEDAEDGVIVKINRAVSIHGEPLDRAGSVDVIVHQNPESGIPVSYASPAGIPHELGALMWANPEKYIGQWVEFKYMERDRAGGYRHPSLVRLREDK